MPFRIWCFIWMICCMSMAGFYVYHNDTLFATMWGFLAGSMTIVNLDMFLQRRNM